VDRQESGGRRGFLAKLGAGVLGLLGVTVAGAGAAEAAAPIDTPENPGPDNCCKLKYKPGALNYIGWGPCSTATYRYIWHCASVFAGSTRCSCCERYTGSSRTKINGSGHICL
jgi:hypothetical protein